MVVAEGKGVVVGTVGIVRVEPNAGNVVPSKVPLGVELRDIDELRLNLLTELTGDLARDSAQDLGVEVSLRVTHRTQPALMDGSLRLHGWFFKIATAELFAYDPETRQFLPLVADKV